MPSTITLTVSINYFGRCLAYQIQENSRSFEGGFRKMIKKEKIIGPIKIVALVTITLEPLS